MVPQWCGRACGTARVRRFVRDVANLAGVGVGRQGTAIGISRISRGRCAEIMWAPFDSPFAKWGNQGNRCPRREYQFLALRYPGPGRRAIYLPEGALHGSPLRGKFSNPHAGAKKTSGVIRLSAHPVERSKGLGSLNAPREFARWLYTCAVRAALSPVRFG